MCVRVHVHVRTAEYASLLVQDNHLYYAAWSQGHFHWNIQQKFLFIIKSFGERLSSVLCITHRLKPDFTVYSIHLDVFPSTALQDNLLFFSITIDLLALSWNYKARNFTEVGLPQSKFAVLIPFFPPLCVSACFFWFRTSCNYLADMMVC